MRKIWIAIVEDHKSVSEGLSSVFNKNNKINVVFTASNGVEFFEKLNIVDRKPDIVIMDVRMPKMDGIETSKRIRKLFPEIKTLVLTSYDDEDIIKALMAIPVNGFLHKVSSVSEITNAIENIFNSGKHYNKRYIDIATDNLYAQQNPEKKVIPNAFSDISKREMEVLQLICNGKNDNEIAFELGISKRTVNVHRNNLLKKTNVKNTAKLVAIAIKNKIVKLDNI